MLKEALEKIETLAVKAVNPTIVKLDADPRRVFVNVGNDLKPIDLNPAPRSHIVESLQDLIEAASKWGESGVVWHNHNHVILIISDDERYDRVTFALKPSHAFNVLKELEEAELRKGQREFVKLLRHDLAGHVPDHLLPKIRKIEATTAGRSAQEVQHGRERGTREFAAELIGAELIPETVDCSLRVYENVPELQPHTVRLSLEITLPPQPVDFLLLPLPDELQAIVRATQAELHDRLVDKLEVPVFFGTP